MAKTKVRETENAIYYTRPGTSKSAQIAAVVAHAAQTALDKYEKDKARKEAMSQVWVQLDADQQKQLYDAWSEKEKKFYGMTPRSKTAVEIAKDEEAISTATIRSEQAKAAPYATRQAAAQAEIANLEAEEKRRINEVIENKEGKYDAWDVGFAKGYRGQDLDKFVLQDKYPEYAEEIMLRESKVGPKFEQQVVGEYFDKLLKDNGEVDPKYTLKTAQAMAAAVTRGDTTGLDQLNKDPSWPKSMQTLAYKQYKLDRDRLQHTIAEDAKSDRRVESQLTIELMNQFKDTGLIGPTTAQSTVKSLMSGKKPEGWTQDRWNKALEMKSQVMQGEMAKRSLEIAESVQGIPEIRSGIDTLRQLQNAEIGEDNTKQIESLKKQLIQRMSQQYRLDPSIIQDENSSWYQYFSNAVDYLSTGAQTGVALAGDAVAGAGQKDLLQRLMADETGGTSAAPNPVGHAGSQPNFGTMSLRSTTPPNVNPQSRVAAAATPERTAALRNQLDRLINEFAQPSTTPERKAVIQQLIRDIDSDPAGKALRNQERTK